MRVSRLIALASTLAAGSAASAQAVLSEVFLNPPGSDNGFESVEVTGQPNMSLAGWFFVVIEGGAVSSGAVGTVDVSVDLSALSLGTNGVGLVRDSATFFNPLPEPGTNTIVFDFNPDIENGSNTYILGFGIAPSVGTDLDVDNDGFLDPGAFAGFTVVDAVAYLESPTEFQYAGQLGGTDLGQLQAISGIGPFTPDALYRVLTPAACGPLRDVGGILADLKRSAGRGGLQRSPGKAIEDQARDRCSLAIAMTATPSSRWNRSIATVRPASSMN